MGNPVWVPPEEQEAIAQKRRENESLEWRQQGNMAYRNRDYEEALVCYMEALTIHDKDPRVYSNISAVYIHRGCYELAIEFAQKSIDVDASFHGAYMRKAVAEEKCGLITSAYETIQQGLRRCASPQNQLELLQLRQFITSAEARRVVRQRAHAFRDNDAQLPGLAGGSDSDSEDV